MHHMYHSMACGMKLTQHHAISLFIRARFTPHHLAMAEVVYGSMDGSRVLACVNGERTRARGQISIRRKKGIRYAAPRVS